MRKRLAVFAIGALGALGVTAAPSAVGASGGDEKVRFDIALEGAQEVPGPGDPDGEGRARIKIQGDEVCFKVEFEGVVVPLTGAHIHQGRAGVAGGVVVDLLGNADRIKYDVEDGKGRFDGCVEDVDAGRVAANPAGFYVNLHNAPFPAGALRGQVAG